MYIIMFSDTSTTDYIKYKLTEMAKDAGDFQ